MLHPTKKILWWINEITDHQEYLLYLLESYGTGWNYDTNHCDSGFSKNEYKEKYKRLRRTI